MLEALLSTLLWGLVVSWFLLTLYLNLKRLFTRSGKRRWAFFHPFCNDGGGGQKVLWCIVQALTQNTSDAIAIYSLEPNKVAIIEKVKARFGIQIASDRFKVVHVTGKGLLNAKGFLTMVMHLMLPTFYAVKCLLKYQPDVFYDTTGYASTLFLVKMLLPSCQTAAYVHYPFISQDMIDKVKQKRADFNNSQAISRSPLLSKGKIYYYQTIFLVYKAIGWFVDFAQTNSSWTHNHMISIWPHLLKKLKLIKLYPPCTVGPLLKVKKPELSSELTMISLAQFRPQKQQGLQLQVLAELLKSNTKRKIRLRMCGSVRGPDDQAIQKSLEKKAADLGVSDSVDFVVNQPFSTIHECLKSSWIGIHTMEAEHFGISIVEMLAAGLLVVAHNSAGPKEDIIRQQEYLATDKGDYLTKLGKILNKTDEELKNLSVKSRQKALTFGQEQFQTRFMESLAPLKSA